MNRSLAHELAHLPEHTRNLLREHHFDEQQCLALAAGLNGGTAAAKAKNCVTGVLELPLEGDVQELPPLGTAESDRLERLGHEALIKGHCALVVLAGGMATRMGGVVKALVPALGEQTFLDLRLKELEALRRRVNQGAVIPLWLMTSHATHAAINEALGSRLDGYSLATFPQRLSVRLTPNGDLFRGADGEPSLHAPGHGDLADALKDSGLLDRFVKSGGRYVTMANLDNLGAGIDARIVGFHIAHGKPATCEVVAKEGTDRGGIPVRHNGRTAILEEFRLPPDFDPSKVHVFNTNTFHFNAQALLDTPFPLTYFTVEKTVEGKKAVQFERLVGELTSYLDTQYLKVPRTGKDSRFLPVKDHDELKERRAEIELVARHRGML